MHYDLAIIGGGINGAGIAADAAGRGLRTVLIEMGDLAGGTSSASSKLIHGGLRYLESYEFRLVREALGERQVLLAKAPHIIWPMRFVVPHVAELRSAFLIRSGLFLYDHLARRGRIPASSAVDLTRDPAGAPLRSHFDRGFSYWDCWVDDARLVILNARQAEEKGAHIWTRSRVRGAAVRDGLWHVTIKSERGELEIAARALVNAAGPWVEGVAATLSRAKSAAPPAKMRLVKGSHIVVPRIAGARDAYLLQSEDGRVVFAIPFEDRFTMIGTTDVPYSGDPGEAAISSEETAYLLAAANGFFRTSLSADDAVWSFAGVRPLYDDENTNPSRVSRDYRLLLSGGEGGAPPLLTVAGGKVTTYRRLAEAALARLAGSFPHMGPAWTADALLPGGVSSGSGLGVLRSNLARTYGALPPSVLDRMLRTYGALTFEVLGDAQTEADLGEALGGGLSEREVLYLKAREWAKEPEDVLWRRTKAGLHIDASEREKAAERISRYL